MTGMGRGLSVNDPTVTTAFRTTLLHQLAILLVVGLLCAITWNALRAIRLRHVDQGRTVSLRQVAALAAEAPARRLLRISFGALWIFDGLLQAQSSMPLGLTSGVITPAASTSPGWVQHLVSSGTTIWNNHPITAAAASVWIQLGLGVLLLVAPRGRWSRSAGLLSAGWGLVVWAFGEAFGGIFAPGASWLFGAPGAVLFYVVAGVLVALPESTWTTPRLGKVLVRSMGLFFVLMAALQAWPGRGSWVGASGAGAPGPLSAMASQMAQVPQPGLTSSLVRHFATFQGSHGWEVNLVVVLSLAVIGALLLSGAETFVRAGMWVSWVCCGLTWIFVQDFGFFGGVGTDPNSMIPIALVVTSGYLAMVRLPASAASPALIQDTPTMAEASRGTWLDQLTPSALLRSVAAVGAALIVLLGAAPMAVASVDPHADPILNEALNGTPNFVSFPAPGFTLTDQSGASVSLAGLRGKTVVLTFLDPVCTTDCPLIAQELRAADVALGSEASKVVMMAVNINPFYRSVLTLAAFDRQEGLDSLENWRFATGSEAQLHSVWDRYGVQVAFSPAGAMVAHTDVIYVIDPQGRVRVVLNSDPGSASATSLHSSFTGVLTTQVRAVAAS